LIKAMLVVGTRPQIIKIAPLFEECKDYDVELQLVHTGQHYDFEMSKAFFDEFGLPSPLVDLEVGSGTHGWQTGQMLIRIEEVLQAPLNARRRSGGSPPRSVRCDRAGARPIRDTRGHGLSSSCPQAEALYPSPSSPRRVAASSAVRWVGGYGQNTH